jgi:hypothetical protein
MLTEYSVENRSAHNESCRGDFMSGKLFTGKCGTNDSNAVAQGRLWGGTRPLRRRLVKTSGHQQAKSSLLAPFVHPSQTITTLTLSALIGAFQLFKIFDRSTASSCANSNPIDQKNSTFISTFFDRLHAHARLRLTATMLYSKAIDGGSTA